MSAFEGRADIKSRSNALYFCVLYKNRARRSIAQQHCPAALPGSMQQQGDGMHFSKPMVGPGRFDHLRLESSKKPQPKTTRDADEVARQRRAAEYDGLKQFLIGASSQQMRPVATADGILRAAKTRDAGGKPPPMSPAAAAIIVAGKKRRNVALAAAPPSTATPRSAATTSSVYGAVAPSSSWWWLLLPPPTTHSSHRSNNRQNVADKESAPMSPRPCRFTGSRCRPPLKSTASSTDLGDAARLLL
jgi:hypothetical protein